MAGALSKMGAFGILKFAIPLAPDVAVAAGPWIAALALQHRLPVLSRDEHFDDIPGIRREDW